MAVRRRVATAVGAALAALLVARGRAGPQVARAPDRPGGVGGPQLGRGAERAPNAGRELGDRRDRRQGTSGWRISHAGPADAIQGWADHVSAATGERVGLYVSTTARRFRVQAYRMGWYGGRGACRVWRSRPLPGRRRPPPVRARDGRSRAALVVQDAVTTWQAYNRWGGRSLYVGPDGSLETHSRVVSFDRPCAAEQGVGDFLGNELPLVRLVESLGLDVTYWTDIDLDRHPERLLGPPGPGLARS
jgi:N,N-dimethylformamidase beta subunit-like, C-terminal